MDLRYLRKILSPCLSNFVCSQFSSYLLSSRIRLGNPLQHSCLENPMDRKAWKAAAHGVAEGRTRLSNFTFNFHFSLSCIGEGNGNPLQCSCLENPRDRRAWQEAIYGVAQSQTRLTRLSSSSSMTEKNLKKIPELLRYTHETNTNIGNKLYFSKNEQ